MAVSYTNCFKLPSAHSECRIFSSSSELCTRVAPVYSCLKTSDPTLHLEDKLLNLFKMDTPSQSSVGGRGKNKRPWSKDEMEALIDELMEMKTDSQWKAENGFRNGYLLHLEKKLNEKFPGCGIKAFPHIESKCKWFKDKYSIINDMLRLSGFKWNDEAQMIECERQSYDDFCKGHPKAGGLWKTKFPYLDRLDLIFGVDRAIGAEVEDMEESVNNLENEEIVNLENDANEPNNGENNSTNDVLSGQPPRKKLKKDKDKGKGKESAEISAINKICDAFAGAVNNMNSHLAKIANAMSSAEERDIAAHERDIAEAESKKSLLTEIGMLPGLLLSQAVKAARIIGATPSMMNAFYASPTDEWKLAVVYDALGDD